MRWGEIGREACSVARTLGVVGDRWTLLVLREAFMRTRRFGEFQQHLGVAKNVLAARLDHLVGHQILERRRYCDRPERFEYRLTEKGLALYPVLMAMVAWGDTWMDPNREGRPIEHVHRRCGQVMHMQGVCSECGEHLDPRAVDPRPGPPLRPGGPRSPRQNP